MAFKGDWIGNHKGDLDSYWPRRQGVELFAGPPRQTHILNSQQLQQDGYVGIYLNDDYDDLTWRPKVGPRMWRSETEPITCEYYTYVTSDGYRPKDASGCIMYWADKEACKRCAKRKKAKYIVGVTLRNNYPFTNHLREKIVYENN